MGKGNKKKAVEKFKSRKELRKDKRLQKKANRVHFQKRKKELKIEFKERMKQKSGGKKNKANGTVAKPTEKHQNENSDTEDGIAEDDHIDDNDEEIESDFELSDEELEMKTKSMLKTR